MFFTKKYKKKIKNIEANLNELNSKFNIFRCQFEKSFEFNRDFDKFLIDNAKERMDANRIDLFDLKRCEFHRDRYRLACEYTENKVVLDIASGTGYGADILYKLGRAKEVYGVEINRDAVDYANTIYGSEFVKYIQGSILDIPFDDSFFDVLTSFETIEHVNDETRQIEEVKRVLKNNGLYIISTPNDWDNSNNEFHVRDYNYESIKKLISDNFEIIKIYNQNSGSIGRKENHDMPRMIYTTNDNNHRTAECFIIVARNKK